MIPVTKISKQSVSSALLEKKKRLREKEKGLPSKKYPADAKSRFGKVFQTKLSSLLISEDPNSEEQLKAMYDEVLDYYNEHNLTEMWLSDENDDNDVKAPVAKKMHTDIKVAPSRTKVIVEEKEKFKTKQPAAAIPPANNPNAALLISNLELSDDSDDGMVGKNSSTFTTSQKNVKLCHICGEGGNGGTSTNVLLDCDECEKSVHLKCNKGDVSLQQALEPRFIFVCSNCKDQETKVDKGASSDTSGAVKSTVGKKDEKTITHKPDISATFATFAAKKKKIINAPGFSSASGVGGVSRSGSSLPNTSGKPFPSFLKKQ